MPRFLLMATILMMGRRRAVNRTGVRFRPGHRQAEHQCQHRPQESHRPNYTVFSFQRPRRNSSALATASVEKAMVTAQATP